MLQVISNDDPLKWNKTVKSFKDHDVYYLAEYSKAFQIHGDGDSLLFHFDNGKIRAINVVMKRDIALDTNFKDKIPKDTYFDIITPYGYGGWIIENEPNKDNIEELSDCFISYCLENNIVSEFVRFHLFSKFLPFYYGETASITNNIVRSLELSLDEILMDFEHKVRKNLKKGQRNELKIIVDHNAKHLDEFLNIYYTTMDRNNAKDSFFFKKEFFDNLNSMEENTVYFHVLHEEKIISTELVLYGDENSYSFLGGTLKDYFPLRPNEFLKFEIIKWAKEKQLKKFVLGGGYGTDDGIFRYKKSFAPNGVREFYIGKKIFNNKAYREFTEIRKSESNFDPNSGFFPIYRQ